jgi:hypothetical protein
MDPNFWMKFSEYGLIGLIIAVLFFILWRMLVWVMAWVKDIEIQHAKEREAWTKQQSEERAVWLCTLDKHNTILVKISDSINEHDRRADERGKYVRDEHKEMITVLGRINGYVDKK